MKLILLALNEINFDVVRGYLDAGKNLPAFKAILDKGVINTASESEYNNLEPWIQWPSVHTGKTFDEHKIFRLGDFVKSSDEQFFEQVERAGFTVGAISPMNATNKLNTPAYFVPDPWTQTPSDDSFISKKLTEGITQAVNDNSNSRLTFNTIFYLVLAFFALVHPKRYISLAIYACKAITKPWQRALFLDKFLYEIHKTLFKRKKPNFSTLFLNGGAHIQHHYFFNSAVINSSKLTNPTWYIDNKIDPVFEMLVVYDEILLDLLKTSNSEIIIATGLSQKPYKQLKYYYRLQNHKEFLDLLGIDYARVVPRMTRDFLVSFDTAEQALIAEKKLSEIFVNDGVKLFGEIDNRGNDLFIVLTYPNEISEKTAIVCPGNNLLLKDYVAFVAIKNGEHQHKGFAYFSDGISKFAPHHGSHVSEIHRSILDFFGIKR